MTVNIRKEGLPYFGLHTTNLRLLHVENFTVQLLSNDPYFDLQNGAFSFTKNHQNIGENQQVVTSGLIGT